ncbi:MAG: TPR end-of-group domain-containing protein, partial [Planctomycetota bacterium JB042]
LEAHVKASEFPTYGNVAAYNAACAHALLGHTDEAFRWLDEAMAKGFGNLAQVRSDPDLVSLRGDARFAEVITKLGGKPATGGADAGDDPPPNVRVFAGTSDRKTSGLFYWDGQGSPGQIELSYGPIAWKGEYDALVGSEQFVGQRWRLGGNFWTTLDTNLDLTLAGVAVPAGLYYVTLEQTEPGKFVLQLNDPAPIRAKQLGAFLAQQTTGGIVVPLEHSESDEVARTLKIEVLTMKGADPRVGSFTIAFGPHRLEAKLRAKLN